MKNVIITQARTGSTRLPGKVLLKAGDKTFLEIHTERIRQSRLATEVIIATSTDEKDSAIEAEAHRLNIACSRGSEQDVLSRYYHAAKEAKADTVVRVTSDCPFADAALIDSMLSFFASNEYDYVTNTFRYSYPDGMDVEIMTFAALEKAFLNAALVSEREHVTPYIRKHSDVEGGDLFRAYNYTNPVPLQQQTRLTLDEPSDLAVLTCLIEKLGTGLPWQAYHGYLLDNPSINTLNNHIPSNEGYHKSLKQDETNN